MKISIFFVVLAFHLLVPVAPRCIGCKAWKSREDYERFKNSTFWEQIGSKINVSKVVEDAKGAGNVLFNFQMNHLPGSGILKTIVEVFTKTDIQYRDGRFRLVSTCGNVTHTRLNARLTEGLLTGLLGPEFGQYAKKNLIFNPYTKQYFKKEVIDGFVYLRLVRFVHDTCSDLVSIQIPVTRSDASPPSPVTPVPVSAEKVGGAQASGTLPILTQVTPTEATPITTLTATPSLVASTQATPTSTDVSAVKSIFSEAQLAELERPTKQGPGLDRLIINTLEHAGVMAMENKVQKFETEEQVAAWYAPENEQKRDLVFLAQKAETCFEMKYLANKQECIKMIVAQRKVKRV